VLSRFTVVSSTKSVKNWEHVRTFGSSFFCTEFHFKWLSLTVPVYTLILNFTKSFKASFLYSSKYNIQWYAYCILCKVNDTVIWFTKSAVLLESKKQLLVVGSLFNIWCWKLKTFTIYEICDILRNFKGAQAWVTCRCATELLSNMQRSSDSSASAWVGLREALTIVNYVN
jgi:hypothetical protein